MYLLQAKKKNPAISGKKKEGNVHITLRHRCIAIDAMEKQ
jgi:hypothetical protein